MLNLLLTSNELGSAIFAIVGIFGLAFIAMLITMKITDSSKKESNDGWGGCLFIIIFAIIIAILSNLSRCEGCSRGSSSGGSEGGYWDNYPRHTQLVNPELKEVNTFIFTTCEA